MFGFTKLDRLAVYCVLVCFPLGVWKLIELVVWFFRHITWITA